MPTCRPHLRFLRLAWVMGVWAFLGACSDMGAGPSGSRDPVEAVYVNDCQHLLAYSGNSSTPDTIFTAPTGWTIGPFCYSADRADNYLVMTQFDAAEYDLTTTLVRLAGDGSTHEIQRYVTCADCEGVASIWGLHLSPDGRYLAIDASYYEWADLLVFDLAQGRTLGFLCAGRYEYTQFLVWHPTENRLYGASRHTIIEYDLDAMSCQELPTPNIRDYMTEAELLQQGFLGERVNHEALTGERWPRVVGLHPNGWHFAYELHDSLYIVSLADSSKELIHGGEYTCWGPHFEIDWNEDFGRDTDPPDFGDRDMIVALDSTILDTIAPLNDSITYSIGQSGPVSYLRCRWGDYMFRSDYMFRGSASAEKFHIAEMDYLLYTFALDLTPNFWFLTGYYDDFHLLTDEEFAAYYQDSVDAFRSDLEMYRGFYFPPTLADKKARYISLVEQDYRMESATAAYLDNRDAAALLDTVRTLWPDVDSAFVDTMATWLQAFDHGDRHKFSLVYQQLHNRHFNFYGRIMIDELEMAMSEYQIEHFYDDFLGAAPAKRHPRMTENYLKRKIYEL